jgi:hypothetical protein
MRNDRTCHALALTIALSTASIAGCAHEPVTDKTARSAGSAAGRRSCDEAVANEAQVLAIAVRADAPGSDLAASLERFAKAPEVTREILAQLAEIRQLVHNVCTDADRTKLEKAASETTEACRTIDSHP